MSEFNIDEWLDDARTTERSVTLYQRADLLGDIDVLEAKLRVAKSIESDGERSLGESDEATTLQEQLDSLYQQMDASKLIVRVGPVSDTKQNEIRDQVRVDLKEEIDKAAATASREALEDARRASITAANDINDLRRAKVGNAIDNINAREVNLRILAEAIVSPRMTLEQVKKLHQKVGDAQVRLLIQAYTQASIEAPKVDVPK